MTSNSELSSHNFTIKITTFLFLLICLVTSSKSFVINERVKRGTVTIEDLPQIKPPTILKKGEPKYPSPGWTHCIKYLNADVRWRSIRGMNTKKLQATQFQCSWFITTEVPGTQIRISFEKLDFGADKSSTCTQQFLEIIDIKLGKSQGRICGDKHKRIGDYVSVGQRVRIDIQGEEGLVEKIRGKKEPFIISYKLVREPPGFRVGGSPSKNKDLTSTVKKTVGVAVDKTNTRSTIYGTKNQPGKDLTNLTPDDPNESRTSLTIWQVVIIIVVAFAIISCIIGVVIKRMIFDKKKKEEYLNLEASKISESNKKADAMILPGLASKISMDSEKKPPKSDHKPKKIKKTPETPAYENLQRSTSKPEGTVKKPPQKVKRHNSHGDATTKTKTAKHRAKTTENKKQNGHHEGSKVTKPTNESTKKLESNAVVTNDTPSNRPSGKTAIKSHDKVSNKPHSTSGGTNRHSRKTDENKNNLKHRSQTKDKSSATHKHGDKSRKRRHKTSEASRTDEKVASNDANKSDEKDDTPASRPDKSSSKHSHSKTRAAKTAHTKPTSDKPKHHKSNPHGKKTEHRSKEHAHKSESGQQKSEDKPKKRKPVSSAHKKATTSNGKKTTDNSKKPHSSHHRHKKSSNENKKDHTETKSKSDVTKSAT